MKDQTKTEFQKDVETEQVFLEQFNVLIKKGFLMRDLINLEQLGIKVNTEFRILIDSYNEKLNSLVKVRLDQELLNYVALAEPMIKENLDKKNQADRVIITLRKSISIARARILEMLEMLTMK